MACKLPVSVCCVAVVLTLMAIEPTTSSDENVKRRHGRGNMGGEGDSTPCYSAFISHQRFLSVPELRSCVKVEVAVLGSPSLIVLMVSVDVKQH